MAAGDYWYLVAAGDYWIREVGGWRVSAEEPSSLAAGGEQAAHSTASLGACNPSVPPHARVWVLARAHSV